MCIPLRRLTRYIEEAKTHFINRNVASTLRRQFTHQPVLIKVYQREEASVLLHSVPSMARNASVERWSSETHWLYKLYRHQCVMKINGASKYPRTPACCPAPVNAGVFYIRDPCKRVLLNGRLLIYHGNYSLSEGSESYMVCS